jgi:hypothetical protein
MSMRLTHRERLPLARGRWVSSAFVLGLLGQSRVLFNQSGQIWPCSEPMSFRQSLLSVPQDLDNTKGRMLGLRAREHTLRAALTQSRRAVVLMQPNCQRPMTARTAPTFNEYDKIVRDLPALANGVLFVRDQGDRKARVSLKRSNERNLSIYHGNSN